RQLRWNPISGRGPCAEREFMGVQHLPWCPLDRVSPLASRSIRVSDSLAGTGSRHFRCWLGSDLLLCSHDLSTQAGPPNKRLKLTAPVVCGKIAFVIIHVRRRSLGASR